MRAEFVGGPVDGEVREVPDWMNIIRVATLDCNLDTIYDATEPYATVTTREVAYMQDLTLPWRFIYQGERQR
jgi:hypothetical protein